MPAWKVLRHGELRRLFMATVIGSLGARFQFTAVGWMIFELTHDAFYVGMIGLVRFIPILLFGLAGGVVADRYERRQTLIVTQSLLGLCSLGLLVSSELGGATLVVIYIITAVAGVVDCVDGPAFSAFIPALIPRPEMPSALSVTILGSQSAAIAGPALAGVVIAAFGAPAALIVDFGAFVVVVVTLLTIRTRSTVVRVATSAWHEALEGLRFLWRTPVLLGVMSVDFFATFFGATAALLPVFAVQSLRGNASAYGLMLSAVPAGSVIGSLIISARPPSSRPGLGVLVAVGVFGAALVGVGLSRTLIVAMAFLALMGAADAISMALRQTVRNLVTPDALLGRIAAAHSTFASGGPQLGDFRAGALGSLIGPAGAFIVGGLGVIVTVVVARIAVPALLTTRIDHELTTDSASNVEYRSCTTDSASESPG